jgi:glycosyl transferase family 25
MSDSLLSRATQNLREYLRLKKGAAITTRGRQDYPAYVINLERSPERRLYITSHLRSEGIEPTIIPAFDGKKLSLPDLVTRGVYNDEVAKKTFDRSLIMGEIGCSLSHISIYEKMVKESVPIALVTEDDAKFAQGALDKLAHIMSAAPEDWDIIQLRHDAKRVEPTRVDGFIEFPYPDNLPVASTSYLIKLSAAQKFAANVYPVRYPADSLLGRASQWGIKVYGTSPQLVGVNNLFPSAIQSRNWKFKVANLIKRIVLKIIG